jgi:hypothetical protein
MLSITLGLVYLVSKYFLTTSPQSFSQVLFWVFSTWGCAGLLLFLPERLARRFDQVDSVFFSFLLLISLPLSFFFIKTTPIWLSYTFLFFSWSITLTEIRKIKVAPLSLISFIFFIGIPVISVIWASGIHSPFYLEKAMLGPLSPSRYAHPDLLYHTSISEMLHTVGFPSTGLDGAPFIHYHVGAHWWIASFGSFLNIPMIDFYNLGYPLVFATLMLKFLLDFAYRLRSSNDQNTKFNFQPQVWAIFSLTFIFLTTPNFYSHSYLKLPFVSESFTFSILFSLLLLNIGVRINHLRAPKWFDVFAILLLIPLIVAMKVSTGAVIFGLALYLYFRLALFKNLTWNLCALLVVPLVLYANKVFNFSINDSNSIVFKPFALHQAIGESFSYSFYFWHFAASIAFSILFFLNKTDPKRLFKLEIVWIITAGSLAPTLMVNMGGEWPYFTWIAFVLIQPFILSLDYIPYKNKWGILITSVLIFSSFNSSMSYSRTCWNELHGVIRKLNHTPHPYPFEGVINDLQKIGALRLELKKDTLLYIPRNNSFWNLVSSCVATTYLPGYQFLVPALTGLPVLDGIAEENCYGTGYCFPSYRNRTAHLSASANDTEICKQSISRNYHQVLIFGTSKRVLCNSLPESNL